MDKDQFISNMIDFVLNKRETVCPSDFGLKDHPDCEYVKCETCQTRAFKESGLWPEGRDE